MFDLFPVSKRQEELNNDILVFGGGGGGVGAGRADYECTVSPGDVHHFGFYKKKIRGRLDKGDSAINVALFHLHLVEFC